MTEQKTYTFKDILEQLVDAVMEWDGDDITEFYNSHFDPEIIYVEDSVWQELGYGEKLYLSTISEKIMDEFESMDGKTLERIYNDNMNQEVKYLEDSVFEYV